MESENSFESEESEQKKCDVCEEVPDHLINLNCNHLMCVFCSLKKILDNENHLINFETLSCELCAQKTDLFEEVQEILFQYLDIENYEIENNQTHLQDEISEKQKTINPIFPIQEENEDSEDDNKIPIEKLLSDNCYEQDIEISNQMENRNRFKIQNAEILKEHENQNYNEQKNNEILDLNQEQNVKKEKSDDKKKENKRKEKNKKNGEFFLELKKINQQLKDDNFFDSQNKEKVLNEEIEFNKNETNFEKDDKKIINKKEIFSNFSFGENDANNYVDFKKILVKSNNNFFEKIRLSKNSEQINISGNKKNVLEKKHKKNLNKALKKNQKTLNNKKHSKEDLNDIVDDKEKIDSKKYYFLKKIGMNKKNYFKKNIIKNQEDNNNENGFDEERRKNKINNEEHRCEEKKNNEKIDHNWDKINSEKSDRIFCENHKDEECIYFDIEYNCYCAVCIVEKGKISERELKIIKNSKREIMDNFFCLVEKITEIKHLKNEEKNHFEKKEKNILSFLDKNLIDIKNTFLQIHEFLKNEEKNFLNFFEKNRKKLEKKWEKPKSIFFESLNKFDSFFEKINKLKTEGNFFSIFNFLFSNKTYLSDIGVLENINKEDNIPNSQYKQYFKTFEKITDKFNLSKNNEYNKNEYFDLCLSENKRNNFSQLKKENVYSKISIEDHDEENFLKKKSLFENISGKKINENDNNFLQKMEFFKHDLEENLRNLIKNFVIESTKKIESIFVFEESFHQKKQNSNKFSDLITSIKNCYPKNAFFSEHTFSKNPEKIKYIFQKKNEKKSISELNQEKSIENSSKFSVSRNSMNQKHSNLSSLLPQSELDILKKYKQKNKTNLSHLQHFIKNKLNYLQLNQRSANINKLGANLSVGNQFAESKFFPTDSLNSLHFIQSKKKLKLLTENSLNKVN